MVPLVVAVDVRVVLRVAVVPDATGQSGVRSLLESKHTGLSTLNTFQKQ